MSDNNFWAFVWTAFFIMIVAVTFAVTSCTTKNNISNNEAMAKAIAHGADPIAARCAIMGGTSTDTACIIVAAKGSQAASAP